MKPPLGFYLPQLRAYLYVYKMLGLLKLFVKRRLIKNKKHNRIMNMFVEQFVLTIQISEYSSPFFLAQKKKGNKRYIGTQIFNKKKKITLKIQYWVLKDKSFWDNVSSVKCPFRPSFEPLQKSRQIRFIAEQIFHKIITYNILNRVPKDDRSIMRHFHWPSGFFQDPGSQI